MFGAFLARAGAAVRSAFVGLVTSPLPSAAASSTIALCLVLVGAFALLVANMEAILERFGAELRVSAYLAEGLAPDAEQALLRRVRGAPGVESVELVSKQAALERFRESSVGRAAIVEGLSENPLPASLEIALAPGRRSADGVRALVDAVEDLPGIDEVGYGHEWVEGYQRAIALIRTAGATIGGVLAFATLLIVASTIRLAVYARQEEIEILRLVGASRLFVAAPFLLEGLIQGFVGGLVGLLLLFGAFHAVVPALGIGVELLLGAAQPVFLDLRGSLWLLALGSGLGLVGSGAALLQDAARR